MHRIVLISSIILLLKVNIGICDQWIDPHNMNTNVKSKYEKLELKNSGELPKQTLDGIDTQDFQVDVFDLSEATLKRIINRLIKSAHVDKSNPEIYKGHIYFNIVPKDYEFLSNVGQHALPPDKLRKLDTIISESFKKHYIDEYLNKIETYQMKLYSLVLNIQNLWLLGVVCLLYFAYQLIKNEFSLAYILKYMITVILIVDLGFRYNHLLNEAEEHNMGVVYSSDCDPNKMTWNEWTRYIFSSRDCQKKIVTPLDALLYQVKSLIIIPMHALGTGMGGFGKNMFTNLPWGLNLIMWPFMLIFSLLFCLFAMTTFTRQPIEFNFFHLLKLRFGDRNHLRKDSDKRLKNEDSHRPLIQHINISVPPAATQPIEDLNSVPGEQSEPELINTLGDNIDQDAPTFIDQDAPTFSKPGTSEKSTNTLYIRDRAPEKDGHTFDNDSRSVKDEIVEDIFSTADDEKNEESLSGVDFEVVPSDQELRQRVVST